LPLELKRLAEPTFKASPSFSIRESFPVVRERIITIGWEKIFLATW